MVGESDALEMNEDHEDKNSRFLFEQHAQTVLEVEGSKDERKVMYDQEQGVRKEQTIYSMYGIARPKKKSNREKPEKLKREDDFLNTMKATEK